MFSALFSAASGGNLGTLFVTLAADSTQLVKGMLQAETTIERSSAAMLAQLKNLAVGATAAFAVVGAAAVIEAAKFESSFAGVRRTVQATEAEYKQLEEAFRDMAKQMPVNVNEINRVAMAAGQLGIENKNIASFTEVMLQMGVTTNLSSDQAADALARFANITQMSQKDFDKLAATVLKLGITSAATESEIVDMGLRIAGAGSQIGMTEAEILSFAAGLTSVGIQAEMGGSAISQMMIRMAKAVSTGSEKLDLFAEVAGMSGEAFAKAFKDDAAEAVLTFMEGLGRLSKSGEDVFTLLENLEIDGIRMTDMMLRASGAGDLFRRTMETGKQAWIDNDALAKAYEERLKTFTSQLTITWNLIKNFLISIGQELIPVLKVLNSMLQDLMKSQDGTNSSMSTFISNIGPAFVTIVGLIGDALWGWKMIIKAGEVAFATWVANTLGLFNFLLTGVTTHIEMMVNVWVEALNTAIRAANMLLPKAQEISEIKWRLDIDTSDLDVNVQAFVETAAEGMAELEKMAAEGSFSERLQKKWQEVTKVVTDENKKMVDDTLKATQMITSLWQAPKAVAVQPAPGTDKITGAMMSDDETAKIMMQGMEMPDRGFSGRGMRGLEDPRLGQLEKLMEEEEQTKQHIQTLNEMEKMGLQLSEDVQNEKLKMLEAYNERTKALQMAQTQIVLNSTTQMFDDLTKIAEATAGKQSGIYKTMFAMSKAFAIAESIVKIQQGIANAASLPWPANLVAIGSVVAATASIVSTIQSAKLEFGGARESGGEVSRGKAFLVGEAGEELFVPNQNGTIVPNDQLGGGQKVKVIINNFTDARPEVRERQEGEEKVIEVLIKRVKNELSSEIRDGRGDVARSMEASFGLRRGTK